MSVAITTSTARGSSELATASSWNGLQEVGGQPSLGRIQAEIPAFASAVTKRPSSPRVPSIT